MNLLHSSKGDEPCALLILLKIHKGIINFLFFRGARGLFDYILYDWRKIWNLPYLPILQLSLHFYKVLISAMKWKYEGQILFYKVLATLNTFIKSGWLLWSNSIHKLETKCKIRCILKKIIHLYWHQNILLYHSLHLQRAKPIFPKFHPSLLTIHLCLCLCFELYQFLSNFVGYLFSRIGKQSNFWIGKAYSYKVKGNLNWGWF